MHGKKVVAIVVQPGVEFGNKTIIKYNKVKAQHLKKHIESQLNSSIIYEAHSTDYQDIQSLKELISDHFAILKVGPQLTFAMREALFALSHIEDTLYKHGIIKNKLSFYRNNYKIHTKQSYTLEKILHRFSKRNKFCYLF